MWGKGGGSLPRAAVKVKTITFPAAESARRAPQAAFTRLRSGVTRPIVR